MGLSLKKLVSKAWDQINPLDNGRTWQNPKGAPVKPGQKAPSAIQQLKSEVKHAPAQAKKAGTAVGLGAVRSVTGAAQGVTGVADLVGKSKGTSQASKLLNSFAQFTDRTAQAEHVDPFLYHASQTGTDLLSLAATGGTAGLLKAPEVITKGVQASRFLEPAMNVMPKITSVADHLMPAEDAVGRAARVAVKSIINPKNQAMNAAFTAKTTGENASKGGKTTIKDVATNYGMGMAGDVGLPVLGSLTKSGVKAAAHGAEQQIGKHLDPAYAHQVEVPDHSFSGSGRNGHSYGVHAEFDTPYGRKVQEVGSVRKNPSGTWTHSSNPRSEGKTFASRGEAAKDLMGKRYQHLHDVFNPEQPKPAPAPAPTPETPKPAAQPLHTTRAYGKTIEMTPENGYHPTPTADGGVVYSKVNRTGSNAKGTQLTNYHYDQAGNKITQAQHDAMVTGRLASSKPKIVSKPTENGTPKVSPRADGKSARVVQIEQRATNRTEKARLQRVKSNKEAATFTDKQNGVVGKKPPAPISKKNAYGKTQLAKVAPGDYQGARIASQQIAEPVREIGARFQHSMNKLQKKSPEEYKNFWQHVEHPPKNASPHLKEAISRWRKAADRVQSHANAYGKKTSYIKNFALHPWDLTDMTEEQLAHGGNGVLGHHAIERKHATIEAGLKAGLKLGDNPTAEGLKYLNGSSNAISKLAGKRALEEADALEKVKTRTLDLGSGHTVKLSENGYRQAKALEAHTLSDKKVIKGARTANVASKSAILSLGQFHPINIAALRAGPALAFKGHPVNAAKGVYRTFRVLGPGGNKYADKVMMKAYDDGMMDKAAQLGMPYGQQGYNKAGTVLNKEHGGVVFGKQMPMMHDQMVRSLVADLEKKNISLASKEAHQAGIVGNATMGFINKEALNMSPRLRQGMSDFMLAGQFTPSKIVTVGKIGAKGMAGKYARADVASNSLAALALIAGIGYVAQQKSDNIKDTLLRALIDPAAPTPFKDAKGNNIEVGLPATYTGEISKLLGISLERGKDGHLKPTFSPPTSMPGNVVDYARARLSPIISDAVSVATNTDFGTKKLYDPNAQAGVKAEQAATTLASGHLPIGLQGAANTKLVKDHAPGNVRDVLDANTPGVNPLAKSGSSSMGFRIKTDKTVGKGKETNDYFTALDNAKKGLNNQEAAAMEIYAGNKKNPVTGKYDVKPNSNDSQTKSKVLLQNPKVLDRLIAMNKQLKQGGAKTDPLWGMSKDQIKAVVAYQSMPYAGPDRAHWYAKNKDWYQPLSDTRGKFFQALPKGDPNKPQAPIEFPSPSKPVADQMEKFNAITESKDRAIFMQAHPEVQQQLDAQAKYGNDMRAATGYSKLDVYPEASNEVKSIIDTYNKLPRHDGPKGGNKTKSLWIQSHPAEFKKMTNYYTGASLYGLEKEASQAEFADTSMSSKGLGEAYNLGKYDIQKNSNGSYAVKDGGSSSGSFSKSSGSSSGSSSSGNANFSFTPVDGWIKRTSKAGHTYYTPPRASSSRRRSSGRSFSSGGGGSSGSGATGMENAYAHDVTLPGANKMKANSVSFTKHTIKGKTKAKAGTKPTLTRKKSKA